jgi:hypothetical protein
MPGGAKPSDEGRSSFLKKRSKRLLSLWLGVAGTSETKVQKFFGSFFQKRTPSFTDTRSGALLCLR